MLSKRLRDRIFVFHRYLGLGVGCVIAMIGITGSLLIFQPDIELYWVTRTFDPIVPKAQRISIEAVVNTVQAIYKDTDLKPTTINVLPENEFYSIRLSSDEGDSRLDIFVNAYTGEILGDRNYNNTLMAKLLQLHVSLFAGEIGTTIIGIAAFSFTSFTGFCWNFYDWTTPLIYAATFTSKPADLGSTSILGRSHLGLDDILHRSNAALPGTITTYIYPPTTPEEVFTIGKRLPSTPKGDGLSSVELDQYSGEILRVYDERSLPLGDRILTTFEPLHYRTFGGLSTRILYVLVGFAPAVLIITGLTMWKHRHKGISKADLLPFSKLL
jgi:uncharacterized iron-regulated membrane protein